MPGETIPGIGARSGTDESTAGVRGHAIPETGAAFN